jgi:FkbM family methyltransferase
MIRRFVSRTLRRVFGSLGYDIVRRPTEGAAPEVEYHPLGTLIKAKKIDTVIDVGANVGQFGLKMRRRGFANLIISIEPLSGPFEKLQAVASSNGPWEVHKNASGDEDRVIEINIAGNTESSSVLPMCRVHEEAAPESRYVGTETVQMYTLDWQFRDRIGKMGRTFLKVDVQGFEAQVLSGAQRVVNDAVGVLLEASVIPMYEGSIVLEDVLHIMREKGFLLHHVEPSFYVRETQQLLQLDCAFFRESPSHL